MVAVAAAAAAATCLRGRRVSKVVRRTCTYRRITIDARCSHAAASCSPRSTIRYSIFDIGFDFQTIKCTRKSSKAEMKFGPNGDKAADATLDAVRCYGQRRRDVFASTVDASTLRIAPLARSLATQFPNTGSRTPRGTTVTPSRHKKTSCRAAPRRKDKNKTTRRGAAQRIASTDARSHPIKIQSQFLFRLRNNSYRHSLYRLVVR